MHWKRRIRQLYLVCFGLLAAQCVSDNDGEVVECVSGEVLCEGQVARMCLDGTSTSDTTCSNLCEPGLGCVECHPGMGRCDDDTLSLCKEDGSGYEVSLVCDALLGLTCSEPEGECIGACSQGNLGQSYIGCEYFPTITASYATSADFSFSLAVVNESESEATVVIEGSTLFLPISRTLAPGALEIIELPWNESLKQSCVRVNTCEETIGRSELVAGGAFHLRSNQPVIVYQFSPLDFDNGQGALSFSADASLLLPVNSLGTNYFAASYPHWRRGPVSYPGLVSVVATEDNTEVIVVPKDTIINSDSVNIFPGQENRILMNKGDVLQMLSQLGDLTGSQVTSDKPIQVLGGHFCTEVPHTITACDHLEESMFPVRSLGNRYLLTAPLSEKVIQTREIRVIATEANTLVQFDPVIENIPIMLENPGDFIEIGDILSDHLVKSNKKIMVAEYMRGSGLSGPGTKTQISDPSLLIAVPVGQFRSSYTIHAPQNYIQNYINVVAPIGASITLDGSSLGALTPIGESEFGVIRHALATSASGNYLLESEEPFGLSVYGFGRNTSFWYAGGLDLNNIILNTNDATSLVLPPIEGTPKAEIQHAKH